MGKLNFAGFSTPIEVQIQYKYIPECIRKSLIVRKWLSFVETPEKKKQRVLKAPHYGLSFITLMAAAEAAMMNLWNPWTLCTEYQYKPLHRKMSVLAWVAVGFCNNLFNKKWHAPLVEYFDWRRLWSDNMTQISQRITGHVPQTGRWPLLDRVA